MGQRFLDDLPISLARDLSLPFSAVEQCEGRRGGRRFQSGSGTIRPSMIGSTKRRP